MSNYLESRQNYIDCYDKLTIEDCRWREKFHNTYEYKEKMEKEYSLSN